MPKRHSPTPVSQGLIEREGVCDRYSALTKKAFMDDYYEKVDVNDDLRVCHKPRSCQSLT